MAQYEIAITRLAEHKNNWQRNGEFIIMEKEYKNIVFYNIVLSLKSIIIWTIYRTQINTL